MKVLLISTCESSGGGAIAARRLMEALNKNGVEAKLMVRDKQSDDPRAVKVGGWLPKLLERLSILPHCGFRRSRLWQADIANFGIFASPERRLVFDINDFDETIRAPWEWDVKRLCASAEICGRDRGFSRQARAAAVYAAADSYRNAMQRFSSMGTLDVWYTHADLENLLREGKKHALTDESRRQMQKAMEKALTRSREEAMQKLTERVDGHVQIRSNPPLVVPFRDMAEPD